MKTKLKVLALPTLALLAYAMAFLLSPETFKTALVFAGTHTLRTHRGLGSPRRDRERIR